jgi:hypothetical protein
VESVEVTEDDVDRDDGVVDARTVGDVFRVVCIAVLGCEVYVTEGYV